MPYIIMNVLAGIFQRLNVLDHSQSLLKARLRISDELFIQVYRSVYNLDQSKGKRYNRWRPRSERTRTAVL